MTHDPTAPAFLPHWRSLPLEDQRRAGLHGPGECTYASDGIELSEHPFSVMIRDPEVAEIADHFWAVGCAPPGPLDLERFDGRMIDGWICAYDAHERERARREHEALERARAQGREAASRGMRPLPVLGARR